MDSKFLCSQLQTLRSENTRLTAEKKTLSTSLNTTQNETKTLQAKLTNLRNAQADAPAKTIPGSAAKARGAGPMGKKEEEEKIKIMQLKEELYSDLTGLMIHNVKRDENEDIYDCIQTGRNGSKLYLFYPPPFYPYPIFLS
jgi:chromosome segregation ATPase